MLIKSESVKLLPIVSPVYSLGFCALHTPILSSVTIKGIQGLSAHTVTLSVYGLSKSGFFLERTVLTSSSGEEFFFHEEEGDLYFDLSCADIKPKQAFFRNLKAPVTGKICVEAVMDDVRFSGDAALTLLPARMYPLGACPSFFAACLSPFHPEISRIIEGVKQQDLDSLYTALKRKSIIYSVKDCDFLRKNTYFDDIQTLFAGRSRMASPLEMAQIFCASALRLGLAPIVAAVRGGKAPRLYCGAAEKGTFDRSIGLSPRDLLSALSERKASIFDVSCLFTGHNVEPTDACRKAFEELTDASFAFIVDVEKVLRDGADFFGLYPEEEPFEKAFLAALRKQSDLQKPTLSSLAEALTRTEKTPLLSYSFSEYGGIPVNVSDFSLFPTLAATNGEYVLSGTLDSFDPFKFAPYSDGVNVLLSPTAPESEPSRTVREEIERYVSSYRQNLAELEKKGALGVPQSLAEQLSGAARFFSACDDGENELYLACGFLRFGKKIAPAALYPVCLTQSANRISFRFTAKVPYVNRLLCEELKRSAAKAFFERYGLPGNDFSDILTCFEALCKEIGFTFLKEAAIGAFPYRRSILAFDIVDKSEKILTDKTARFLLGNETASPAPLPERRAYREAVRKLSLILSRPVRDDALFAAALCRDEDLALSSHDAALCLDAALAAVQNDFHLGFSSLLCADEKATLSAFEEALCENGFSEPTLLLCEGCDPKVLLRKKLESLSSAPLPEEGDEQTPSETEREYFLLRDRLFAYRDAKERRYDFDFSFYDAARAYTVAGTKLTEEEREILIEPEALFYPDMGKASVEALFGAGRDLCRAARALFPDRSYREHSFFSVGTDDSSLPLPTVSHLAEKCRLATEEFLPVARKVAEIMGFSYADIVSLPSLYAFLSLAVLTLKRYDAGITDALLSCDIYTLSQKLASLSESAKEIRNEKSNLSEFDEGIYTLDAKELFRKWADGHDMSRSDITKTVNAFRTVDADSSDGIKKGTSEILQSLYRLSELCARFDEESASVSPLFAGYWNDAGTDFAKLSELLDFAKNSDVLLKKIFGTDTEARKNAAKHLPDAAGRLLAEKELSEDILHAAGLFDRMFSDESSFLRLASLLGVDLYALSFADGILSENAGLYTLLCDWQSGIELLPRVAEYNRCCKRARSLGLSVFVDYLADHPATAGTEAIFLRSQLHLILKQIALYDKKLLSYPDYEKDLERFRTLHAERLLQNRDDEKRLYFRRCSAYIRENPEKASAFAEDLERDSVCAEDIFLRYGDLLRTLFPIVLAQPSYTGFLSGFETAVIADAGRLLPEKVLSVLPAAKHKLFLFDPLTCRKDSAAALLQNSGFPVFSPVFRGETRVRSLSHFLSPVSVFDRESGKNIPEAQTLGLELLKALEQQPDGKIALLAANDPQIGALREVLRILCEKSPAVLQAVNERRIDILPAYSLLLRKYDLVLCSAVYGIEGGETERFLDPHLLLSALCHADAGQALFVSSLNPRRYPEPIGARAALNTAVASSMAAEGQSALYSFTDRTERPAESAVEFCRLLSRKNIPCALTQNRLGVVCRDGENRVLCRFDEDGAFFDFTLYGNEKIHFLDSAALYLDPQKLLCEIKPQPQTNEKEDAI